METILSGLGNRVFLMNNVHDDEPVVFQTRWALSYLRGPLTREQIGRLMAERKATPARSVSEGVPSDSCSSECSRWCSRTATNGRGYAAARAAAGDCRAVRGSAGEPAAGSEGALQAGAARPGEGALHADDSRRRCVAGRGAALAHRWPAAAGLVGDGRYASWKSAPDLETQPEAGAQFAELPGELSRPKRYSELSTALKDHLYRNRKLNLWKCAALKQTSQPDESEAEFRVRLGQLAREQRDGLVEKLRQKYAPKLASLQERIRKAQVKVEKEKSQANEKTLSAVSSRRARRCLARCSAASWPARPT